MNDEIQTPSPESASEIPVVELAPVAAPVVEAAPVVPAVEPAPVIAPVPVVGAVEAPAPKPFKHWLNPHFKQFK